MPDPIALDIIAVARTPFQEKFGIPRQPGLAESVEGRIELLPPYDRPECVRGLEGYSHVWLLFVFHETREHGWSPTVRPPRLGGNRRLGVFATRSTFRPNPIGLSCVRLLEVVAGAGKVALRVAGLDLLDGTPIVDIKPYVPFSDCRADARAELVPDAPPALEVRFGDSAAAQCPDELRPLIEDVLSQDPRPAYQIDDAREYGVRLAGYNVRFRVVDGVAVVHAIAPSPPETAPDAPA